MSHQMRWLRAGRLDKLTNRPDMIRHAQRHRWRYADRLMDAATISVACQLAVIFWPAN